jgi:hypothetical protein
LSTAVDQSLGVWSPLGHTSVLVAPCIFNSATAIDVRRPTHPCFDGKEHLEIGNKKQRHVGSRWRQRDMHGRLVSNTVMLLIVHGPPPDDELFCTRRLVEASNSNNTVM